jgi:homocitrate synthase
VAEAVQINIPFNNCITGFCAFTHKAGIHAKAILNNPSTYEIIDPKGFGMTRYIHFRISTDWLERHQIKNATAQHRDD